MCRVAVIQRPGRHLLQTFGSTRLCRLRRLVAMAKDQGAKVSRLVCITLPLVRVLKICSDRSLLPWRVATIESCSVAPLPSFCNALGNSLLLHWVFAAAGYSLFAAVLLTPRVMSSYQSHHFVRTPRSPIRPDVHPCLEEPHPISRLRH